MTNEAGIKKILRLLVLVTKAGRVRQGGKSGEWGKEVALLLQSENTNYYNLNVGEVTEIHDA